MVDASYSGFSPLLRNAVATGAWGWHVDTGLHVLRLILGGVLDRFPRLQLIIGHMGEGLPSMISRAAWITNPISGVARPLEEYFAQNIHVTTSGLFDYALFAAAMHALGIDRILFAVDYPYSQMTWHGAFLDGLPGERSGQGEDRLRQRRAAPRAE